MKSKERPNLKAMDRWRGDMLEAISLAQLIIGFSNRKETPLPTEKCIMQVIQNDTLFLCSYEPNIDKSIPNLIGSATVIEGKHKGIGFNVWENNDSEFIYYKIIQ